MSSIVIFRFWPPVASEVGYEVVWFLNSRSLNNFVVQQRRKNVFFHELHQPLKAIFGLGWPQRSNMRLIRGCWSTLEFSCNLKNASFDELISVLASGGLWWPLVASEVGTEFILFVENDLKMLSLSFPIFNFWPPVTSEVVEQFWKSAISIPPEFWHENWNGTFRDICKHCVAKAFHHLSFSEQI